jgi:hypothetical protein
MSQAHSLGGAEQDRSISSRRSLAHRVALVAVVSLVFMTAYELLKTLLFPSIKRWDSHLVTIVVSGAIATLAACFALGRDDRLRQSEESYCHLVERSPEAMCCIPAYVAGIVAPTAAGLRPSLGMAARRARSWAHEMLRLDRQ